MKKVLLFGFFLSFFCSIAQDGRMDVTFGDDGVVITSIDENHNFGETVLQQADGKLLVSGSIYNDNGNDNEGRFLLRYDTTGNLDPSFGDGGKVLSIDSGRNFEASSVILDSNQKILFGGGYAENQIRFFKILRYTATGTLDLSFGDNGAIVIPSSIGGTRLIASVDGKFLVVQFKSGQEIHISRFLQNGEIDQDFGAGGTTVTAVPIEGFVMEEVKNDLNGNLFICAKKNNLSNAEILLLKFTTDGYLDNSFGSNGLIEENIISPVQYGFSNVSFDFTPDGKIIMAGSIGKCIDLNEVIYQSFMLKYTPDGLPDVSFRGNGSLFFPLSYYVITQILVQANQKILVTGHIPDCFEGTHYFIWRYHDQGHQDYSFSNSMNFDFEFSHSLMQPDGKIVGVGFTHWYEGNEDVVLFRHNNNQLSVPEVNQNKIVVYPNPSSGKFLIQNIEVGLTYQVIDVVGKLIFSGKTSDQTEIDLSAFQDGMYFLNINGHIFRLLKK